MQSHAESMKKILGAWLCTYHKWDVKNGFAYVLTIFSLISDSLGGVTTLGFWFLGAIINRLSVSLSEPKISGVEAKAPSDPPSNVVPADRN